MAARKKPKGKEWIEFAEAWEDYDHNGKLSLADRYGVTYDTAKHWYSEGSTDPAEELEKEAPPMQLTVDDLLAMRPAINLDFVSFDLESSNLKADFSILLSAVIKPFGQTPMVFRADNYPTWEEARANDKQIVADIAQELGKHAIIVTHYGSTGNFDIPFLQAKLVHHGLAPLPPLFGIDTYRIAKRNFQISSRRLKNLVSYFGIGNKEGVEGQLWVDAAYNGSREAMDRIVEHNIIDCEVLEKLGCLSFPYLRSIPRL